MDQFLIGASPIPSGEYFGIDSSNIVQTRVDGELPIATAESFPEQDGVFVEPLTIPASMFLSY